MKAPAYFVLLLTSVLCLALAVALMLLARTNQRTQLQLQARQQALSSGLFGQQGRQITSSVLQDLANAGVTNARVRALLEKHGFRVESTATPDASTGSVQAAEEQDATGGME